jgi:protein-tyrosine-phosphatase
MLHPVRRYRAHRRLAQARPVREILVLCYGNICRSPYAASYLIRTLRARGLDTSVEQGGFFGPDREAHDTALAVARDRGVDLTGHRSRLVTLKEAERAGLVIVMESAQARRITREFGVSASRILILGDLDPGPILTRKISDPYGERPEVFVETYDRIDRCIHALVATLTLDPTLQPPAGASQ